MKNTPKRLFKYFKSLYAKNENQFRPFYFYGCILTYFGNVIINYFLLRKLLESPFNFAQPMNISSLECSP